jgi:putative transposase
MDGQLADGRASRVLTVADHWRRERVLFEARFRFTGDSVVAAISRFAITLSLPTSITPDHGSEFASSA